MPEPPSDPAQAELLAQLHAVQDEVEAHYAARRRAEAEAEALRAERDRLRHALGEMEASRLWRMTGPARALLERLRR